MKLPAISVRQPWSSAIFHLMKDVENRTWENAYRGPLVIHAGQQEDREAGEVRRLLGKCAQPRGVLLGIVDLVNIVTGSDSQWADPDQFNWILRNPRLFPEPIPCSGRLGLFEVQIPDELAAALKVTR